MKRIEAIIQPNMLEAVVKVLRKTGVGGFTVLDGKGQGAAEPPLVGEYYSKNIVIVVVDDEKGEEIQYNAVDTIVTVVDDSKVDSIVSAISQAAYSGSKGDGKIFVSTIDNAFDIFTKEKNSKAL